MDKSFLRFGPFVLLQITDGGQCVLADGLVISSQTICILVFTVLVFLLHLVLLLCHLFDDIGDDDDIPSAIWIDHLGHLNRSVHIVFARDLWQYLKAPTSATSLDAIQAPIQWSVLDRVVIVVTHTAGPIALKSVSFWIIGRIQRLANVISGFNPFKLTELWLFISSSGGFFWAILSIDALTTGQRLLNLLHFFLDVIKVEDLLLNRAAIGLVNGWFCRGWVQFVSVQYFFNGFHCYVPITVHLCVFCIRYERLHRPVNKLPLSFFGHDFCTQGVLKFIKVRWDSKLLAQVLL